MRKNKSVKSTSSDLSCLDPRRGIDFIRDPIYQYIPFTKSIDEFDKYYLSKYNLNHEILGKEIIAKYFFKLISKIRRSPFGDLDKSIVPQDVIDVLYPCDKEGNLKPGLEVWKTLLYKIISGLYSTDKLDYLIRDSYFCGTPEFAIIDVKRLILTSMLTDKGLALHLTSKDSSLVPFLLSRLYMYQAVYYHRYVRAFELTVGETIPEMMKLLKLGNPRNNLERYWVIDDFYIYSLCKQWRKEKGKKGKISKIWLSALNGRYKWEEIHYMPIYIEKDEKKWPKHLELLRNPAGLKTYIETMLKENLKKKRLPYSDLFIDLPVLDVRPENPLGKDKEQMIFIFDPFSNKLDPTEFIDLIKNLPLKLIFSRFFCRSDSKYKAKLARVCRALFSETTESKSSIAETHM